MVRRVFVEKKKGFDLEAQRMYRDLKENLRIAGLSGVRLINRYDVEGISDEEYESAKRTISSPPRFPLLRIRRTYLIHQICRFPESVSRLLLLQS